VQDAAQWARWGFDYLKYDWFPNDLDSTRDMARALRGCGRDLVLSLSNNLPLASVPDTARHAQLWRTTGDIRDAWSLGTPTTDGFQGIADILRHHTPFQRFQTPGNWNDPDMLVLGQVGWGEGLRPTRLTSAEQRTHFALWCLWSAPLLIGCPIETLDDATLALLTHEELIDLDQDPLGVQALVARQTADECVLWKPLHDGAVAVGCINLSDEPRGVEASLTELGLEGTHCVRDVLARRDLPATTRGIGAGLEPHDIAVFVLRRG
jgi:alpha-galactosidase